MFHIIENYFNEDEIEAIHEELDSLKEFLNRPENTGTARTLTGKPKKENKGLFLDEHYKESRDRSIILKLNRKIYTEEVKHKLSQCHWFFRYIGESKHDSTLVSYYTKGDHYKTHRDKSFLTAIYYTWKEPKPFEGGELYIEDQLVPVQNNCLVVFPSVLEHRVERLTEGEGRWAISQFISLDTPPSPPVKKLVPVDQFENFLTIPEFNKISTVLFTSPSWQFSGKSGTGPGKFWFMNLIDDSYFSQTLFERIKEKTGLKLRLDRVYANGQSFGQNGDFHQDSTEPNAVTFILYMNEIPDTDLDLWGGETQFRKDDFKILSYQPRTNKGIIFPSSLWHRGLGPSRHVAEMRITVAWKLTVLTYR